MDILRKELNEIYQSQNLADETLSRDIVDVQIETAENFASITNGCAVVTDASKDKCYVHSGNFGTLMGYASQSPSYFEADSSDEDIIYELIHPEDLVDKRMLEYEFFKLVNGAEIHSKQSYIAKCRIRMRDRNNAYRLVDNTTQLISLSPRGKIWLILCTYTLSTSLDRGMGIDPTIINVATGQIASLSLGSRREKLLTQRQKQILRLIRDGKSSKMIADELHISIHTVNRHRQDIIEKLSVGNSVEAVKAATLMRLIE